MTEAIVLVAAPGDRVPGVDLALLDHPARERILGLPEVTALDVDDEDSVLIVRAEDHDAPAGWPSVRITLSDAEVADLTRAEVGISSPGYADPTIGDER